MHVRIAGQVQGVCFRDFVDRSAAELGLNGWVRNRSDGSVEAIFQGRRDSIEEMIERCREGPPAAQVTGLEVREEDDAATVLSRFEVRRTL